MRQAGRYLPEYQAIKAKHSFLEMCRSPELASEVTLQPLRRFDMDAAIVFADILLPLEAMGLKIDFNPGPKVESPLRSPAEIAALKPSDPLSALEFLMKALRQLREMLPAEKTLIGFAGAPWTMACYMLEQGPFKHFQGTQVFAYEHSSAMHELLGKLSEFTGEYLLAQLESGADVVQLFDSWGGNLNLEDYCRFSLPYIHRVFEKVRSSGRPGILYVNGSAHLLPALAECGADCLSVDSRTPLNSAQKTFGKGCVQGNFDPTHLFGSAEEVDQRVSKMFGTLATKKGYVANLGHGVLQRTAPENVKAFVDSVKRGWR